MHLPNMPDLIGDVLFRTLVEEFGASQPAEVNNEEVEHQGEMFCLVNGSMIFFPAVLAGEPVPGELVLELAEQTEAFDEVDFLQAAQRVVARLIEAGPAPTPAKTVEHPGEA